MKTVKRTGPKCDPCGTPAVISCGDESVESTRTTSFLSLR